MKRPQGFDGPDVPRAHVPTSVPSTAPRTGDSGDSSPDLTPAVTGVVTTSIPMVHADEVASRQDLPRIAVPRGADAVSRGRSATRKVARVLRAARAERKRLERDEVRRFTKRARRRRMAWLVSVGAVVVLVLGVTLVGVSPLLALRHVEVVGASGVDPNAVAAKLENQVGRPLVLLDQAEISSALAGFPLIRSYTLESHPPDTLVVRIVERQPIGAVQQGSAFVLVDAAKVAISSSAARPEGFPVIAVDDAVEANAVSGFAAAVAVLSSLPAEVLARVDTISAKTKDDVSFTLRDSGVNVVWGGAEDSALKAADLAALLTSAPGANRYDVSSPHSVTTG